MKTSENTKVKKGKLLVVVLTSGMIGQSSPLIETCHKQMNELQTSPLNRKSKPGQSAKGLPSCNISHLVQGSKGYSVSTIMKFHSKSKLFTAIIYKIPQCGVI